MRLVCSFWRRCCAPHPPIQVKKSRTVTSFNWNTKRNPSFALTQFLTPTSSPATSQPQQWLIRDETDDQDVSGGKKGSRTRIGGTWSVVHFALSKVNGPSLSGTESDRDNAKWMEWSIQLDTLYSQNRKVYQSYIWHDLSFSSAPRNQRSVHCRSHLQRLSRAGNRDFDGERKSWTARQTWSDRCQCWKNEMKSEKNLFRVPYALPNNWVLNDSPKSSFSVFWERVLMGQLPM